MWTMKSLLSAQAIRHCETTIMTLGQTNQKTVLELDLAAYSDVASALEEHLDVQAVKTFQDQIQSFVDEGLNQLGIRRDDVVFATAGDNALLIFDDPGIMHQFAKIVQEATVKHNRKKSVESAKRWFRMGAATGAVLVIAEERRIVGTTVARAVRLEAAAEKGELLIDTETYDALPEEIKKFYGEEEVVAGKRDERFTVRRCALVSTTDRLGKIIAQPKPAAEDKNVKADKLEQTLVEVVEFAPAVEQVAEVPQLPPIIPVGATEPPAVEGTGRSKFFYVWRVLVPLAVLGLIIYYFNSRNAQELKQQSDQAKQESEKIPQRALESPNAIANKSPSETDLFGDPVIVQATGFQIKRSELIQLVNGAKVNATSAGQTLQPDFDIVLLNQLITIRVLLQRATDSDRVSGQAEALSQYTTLKEKFGSEEAFQRQLKLIGMTSEELIAHATEEATAKLVLQRELNTSNSDEIKKLSPSFVGILKTDYHVEITDQVLKQREEKLVNQ